MDSEGYTPRLRSTATLEKQTSTPGVLVDSHSQSSPYSVHSETEAVPNPVALELTKIAPLREDELDEAGGGEMGVTGLTGNWVVLIFKVP
ncbi:MAG: hypothetical protein RIQ94_1487 [Pseudomonadota bacterium]